MNFCSNLSKLDFFSLFLANTPLFARLFTKYIQTSMITSIKATPEKNLRNIKYQNQRVFSMTFDYNIQVLIIVKIGEIRELKLGIYFCEQILEKICNSNVIFFESKFITINYF